MRKTNQEYDLNKEFPDVQIHGYYTSLVYHRNGSPEKSQWRISIDEEFDCFVSCKIKNWIDNDRGWGIIVSGGCVKMVGITKKGEEVFIARFENKMNNDKWHGYPADIKSKTEDIPIDSVLKVWKELGYISKPQYIKIRRGIL